MAQFGNTVILVNGEFFTRCESQHVDSITDSLELDGFTVSDETWLPKEDPVHESWGSAFVVALIVKTDEGNEAEFCK